MSNLRSLEKTGDHSLVFSLFEAVSDRSASIIPVWRHGEVDRTASIAPASHASYPKTEIKKRLKTFSQIKDEYKINGSIYRTGRSETFSENAEKFGLPGVTKARISEHPKNDHEKPKEEIIERTFAKGG